MISWLGSNLVVGLMALAMLAALVYRLVMRPGLLAADMELAWDYTSQPAPAADDALARRFGRKAVAAFGNAPEGHIARLALVNRGRQPVEPADFRGALRLVLPAGSTALAVTGAGDTAAVSGNQVTLMPCAVRPGNALLFDILVVGPAAPVRLDGGLRDAPALRQLRGKSRYFPADG